MARLKMCGLLMAAASLLPVAAYAASTADLRIRATMKSFRVGGAGTYNITVSNRGPNATGDVVTVIDPLPTGIHFVSGSGAGWTCSAAAGVVTCTHPGALDAVSTSSLRLSIGADSTAARLTVNSITVVYAGDPNPANNTVTKSTVIKPARGPLPPSTPTPVPSGGGGGGPTPTNTPLPTSVPVNANETDLSMLDTNNGAFFVGANGSYTLTVTNEGGDDTNTTITVTDELPNGLGFVSGGGNGWTCSADGQTVTCTNPAPLAAGESTNFILMVSVSSDAFPTVTNVATVSYPADTDPSNDTAKKPTPVRAG